MRLDRLRRLGQNVPSELRLSGMGRGDESLGEDSPQGSAEAERPRVGSSDDPINDLSGLVLDSSSGPTASSPKPRPAPSTPPGPKKRRNASSKPSASPLSGLVIEPEGGPDRGSTRPRKSGDRRSERTARAPRADEEESGDWFPIVLAGYASALTLLLAGLFALGWVRAPESEPDLMDSDEEMVVEADRGRTIPELVPMGDRFVFEGRDNVDRGLRADRSFVTSKPVTLDQTHRVNLGEAIDLGRLRILPRRIRLAKVRMIRASLLNPDQVHRREEDDGDALWLLLEIQNRDPRMAFAPMDEAFLREPQGRAGQSFIQVDRRGDSGRIRLYDRLAVESPWQIEGQIFRELRPLEQYRTWIVSEPGIHRFLGRNASLLWRIQLRTASDQVEVLGVQVTASQVAEAIRLRDQQRAAQPNTTGGSDSRTEADPFDQPARDAGAEATRPEGMVPN